MIQRIDILGINGTPFRAVLVPAGEPCPNHEDGYKKEDMLEFYDRRYSHTLDGQFITRYYVQTLLQDHELISDCNMRGLDLMGAIPTWKIDARTVKIVLDWALYHTYLKPEPVTHG
jgi:hypothetical protein